MTISPVTLNNRWVCLEPISPDHASALYDIGQDAQSWRFLPRPCFHSLTDTQEWIQDALKLADKQQHITFVIKDRLRNRIAGSTRFLSIRPEHKGVEIGYTWLGAEFQRSHVNTATKLCLLHHAFDTLGCVRVELKTDARNLRSRQAIARIGATEEGHLRQHMIVQNGHLRDSVMFSILNTEWPAIQQTLSHRLGSIPVSGVYP